MEQQNEYGKVADFHDSYVTFKDDIPFFLEEAKRVTGEILEPMCGTGRVSLPLLESGVRLTCVDNSPEMLAELKESLKRRKLTAPVHEMDICSLKLEQRFDLAFITFNSFSELLTGEAQRAALAGIHKHLTDYGRFICTLHNPKIRMKDVDGRKKLLGKKPLRRQYGVVAMWKRESYDPETRIVSIHQDFEAYGRNSLPLFVREMHLCFRVIEPGEFEQLAKSAGFSIAGLYGDYSCAPFDETASPYMNWILTK